MKTSLKILIFFIETVKVSQKISLLSFLTLQARDADDIFAFQHLVCCIFSLNLLKQKFKPHFPQVLNQMYT